MAEVTDEEAEASGKDLRTGISICQPTIRTFHNKDIINKEWSTASHVPKNSAQLPTKPTSSTSSLTTIAPKNYEKASNSSKKTPKNAKTSSIKPNNNKSN